MRNLNPQFSHPSQIGLYAYVDEAGDEGFSQGSSRNWLLLGAFIVRKEDQSTAFDAIDFLKKALNFKSMDDELHWRNLRHEKKKVIVRELEKVPFTAMVVAVWKWGLSEEDKRNLACFPRLYFFLVKLLLERLSWYARDTGTLVEITFSNRSHVSYDLLRHYVFTTLRQGDANHSIDFNYLGPVRVVQNKQRKLLQAADAIASGFLNGIQSDYYGNVETGYSEKLKEKFWRKESKLYGYGVKLLPSDREAEIKKSNELFSLL